MLFDGAMHGRLVDIVLGNHGVYGPMIQTHAAIKIGLARGLS